MVDPAPTQNQSLFGQPPPANNVSTQIQQTQEQRKQEFFHGNTPSYAEQRETYAVSLRKEKRIELIKMKRARLTLLPESPAPQQQQQATKVPVTLSQVRQMPPEQFQESKESFVFNESEADAIIELISTSTDDYQKYIGVYALRKLMTSMSYAQGLYEQVVFESGCDRIIVRCAARKDYPDMQLEAIWCLTNIASGRNLVRTLIDSSILPTLKELLFADETPVAVREQVIWCFGNIAGDSAQSRDNILAMGVVGPMTAALLPAEEGSTFMRNVTWCLVSFFKGEPAANYKLVTPIVPALVITLVRTQTDQVISDILAGVKEFTSDASESSLAAVLDACDNSIQRILQLADHPNVDRIASVAIRILGHFLASYNERFPMAVIGAGALTAFARLLDHPKPIIRSAVTNSLASVTARSPERVQLCIDNGIVQNLVNKMAHDGDIKVRSDAIWTMSNALYAGSPQQAEAIISMGFLEASKASLDQTKDTKVIFVILEGLIFTLERGEKVKVDNVNPFARAMTECELQEKLEQLLDQYPETQVCYKCQKLLEDFFPASDNQEMIQTELQGSDPGAIEEAGFRI